jgi:hypothetical protein
MTSIFIKTYSGDYKWLQYLLPSIEKYANGFEEVIIVADNDGTRIPEEYLNMIKKYKVSVIYENLPTKQPIWTECGIGYIWQQYIKLNWFRYCSSEAVLILDSDEIIITNMAPDDFKHNGKWIWGYRPWDKAGKAICHKLATDIILRIDTECEAMCEVGFVLTRHTTQRLLAYLSDKDLWDFIVERNIGKMSEYNIYGSYVYHIYGDDYFHNIDGQIPRKYMICIRWSWGGITEEIDRENRRYLE